ncbi:hypothetical protein VCSRO103_2673 [Vibrio cholerae]|nr:hypothetical protein VCSRO103_2673 [Vibrio cholerae]
MNNVSMFSNISRATTGPDAGAGGAGGAGGATGDLKTTEVGKTFEGYVAIADAAIQTFIGTNTDANGNLSLSAGQSLELQRLMGDQSIAVQTGTSTLKSIKDSISSAARNI